MLINSRQLIGLPVITKSEQSLGKLASFDIEVDSGRMSVLHVVSKRIVSGLVGDELLIPWSAVIEITEEKIIVQDGFVEQRQGAFARLTKSVTSSALSKDDTYADMA